MPTVTFLGHSCFEIREGESLGVVGESGCGKSVTAQSIMNLLPKRNAEIAGGRITYIAQNGESIPITDLDTDSPAMRSVRGSEIAIS